MNIEIAKNKVKWGAKYRKINSHIDYSTISFNYYLPLLNEIDRHKFQTWFDKFNKSNKPNKNYIRASI